MSQSGSLALALDPSRAARFASCKIVLFQHGSHGRAKDFATIRNLLERKWTYHGADLICWSTPINEGLRTDCGLVVCGDRLASELGKALEEISHVYTKVHLSCISHSFGGLITRRALAVLNKEKQLSNIELDAFVTLASPHVSALQINAVLRLVARGLGKVLSTAYKDLMLDSEALDALCSPDFLAPLGRFERRILYTCTQKDHLVKAETGGLVVLDGGIASNLERLPQAVPDHPHVCQGLCLEPLSADSPYCCRRIQMADPSGYPAGKSDLSEMVHSLHVAEVFKRPDNCDGSRAVRAAQMLCALRSIGNWTLYFVHFDESTCCKFKDHEAIICKKASFGLDVVEHLVEELISVDRTHVDTGSVELKGF